MSGFSFSSWFQKRRPAKSRPERPQRRPRIEALEQRLPPGDLFGLFAGDPFALLTSPPPPVAPMPGQSEPPPAPPMPPAPLPPLFLPPPPASGGSGTTTSETTSSSSTPPLSTIYNTTSPTNGYQFQPFSPPPPGGSGGTGSPTGPAPGGEGGSPGNTPTTGMAMVTDITNDSGQSVASGYTNDARPTVHGVAGPNQTLQLLLNGQVTATVTANGEGKWSHEVSIALPEGVATFSAQPEGAAAPAADGMTTTIDLTAPTLTLEANDFVGSRDTAWVRIIAEDNYALAPDFSIDVDLNHNGSFDDTGEKDYAVSQLAEFDLQGLEEGTYDLRARARDLAGNEATSDIVQMQVDPNAGFLGSQLLIQLASLSDSAPPMPPGGSMPGQMPPGGMPGQGGQTIPQHLADAMRFDDQGRVMIHARATLPKYLDGFKADLEELGMEVVHLTPSSNMVTGYLPPDQLWAMVDLDHFSAAAPVGRAMTLAGSVQTEGDAIMRADAFRSSTGVDGSGINIGVMSDSVDQVNGGISDSQSTGDLPNNVTVLADFSGGTDEGRAMLEIVHDVAPGASLFYRTAFISEPDFAQGIRDLANAGCQVITDDIVYFNQPLFSGGRMGQAVEEVAARGVVFTTAAGNFGNGGWRAAWAGTSTTVDGTSGTFFDFGGGDVFQDFTLADGDQITVNFAWDEAYLEGGDPGANFQVNLDLAVHIINRDDNTIAATFDNNNPNVDEASELLQWTNDQGTSNLAFAFQLNSSSAPSRVGWVYFDNGVNLPINAEGGTGPTIVGHRLEEAAIACGAAGVIDPSQPENFSSYGGNMEVFFAPDGTRFAQPNIRQKPDVTGPDNVRTAFLDFDPFPGTSAAAPHVAAAAALLMAQSGITDDAFLIQDHLKQTALNLLAPGFDDQTGFGLVQLAPITATGLDVTELNETSDGAFNLGVISDSQRYTRLRIETKESGLPDYDWFKFTAGTSGQVTVSIGRARRLEVQLYTFSGGFLSPVGTSTAVNAGDVLFVEIKGILQQNQGTYNLSINVG